MKQVEYFLENLCYLTEIPCSIWSTEKNGWVWSAGQKSQYITLADIKIVIDVLTETNAQEAPFVLPESEIFYYGICACADHRKAVLGPIAMMEPSYKEKSDFRKKNHMHIEIGDMKFSIKSMLYLVRTLGIIYHYYSGKKSALMEVLCYNPDIKIMKEIAYENMVHSLENAENAKENFSYQNTQRIKQLIIQGDYHALEKEMDSFDNEHMGDFTTSAFKRFEYMAVTSVNIHTQAAVEGGLPSSIAYDLSDIYCRRIESCQTIEEIQQIMLTMSKDYIMRVKEYKEQRRDSAYVERSKDYIIKNINRPICLEDIARDVRLDKCYLSRTFNRKEGMHLQEYIHRERIKVASNMLKYSDVPLASIASYLCFGSQSHFGAVYKKYEGITPKQYRDRNQVLDYLNHATRQ